jgi:transcriptional regulator with XRE-family HTH domain
MVDDFLLRFGAVVKRLRQQGGMTQADLAERLGMARTSVSNLEAGGQNLPINSLPALAAALGVRADALVADALHGAQANTGDDLLTSVEDPALRDWATRVVANRQASSSIDRAGAAVRARRTRSPR